MKPPSITDATDHRGFRADINGLRAWAVAAVVLYHFGVGGVGGGFVGVDVFFVISGFLMTGIVVRQLETGRFDLIGFYLARARRIVPALIVLCAFLLCIGWFVLLPPDYAMLSTHAIASLTFISNIKYWTEAGYFDIESHEKWLLHTWSLSVEWQFYLALPVILFVVWRIRPGRIAQVWAVAGGFVLSLALTIAITPLQATMAFYSLPTRAWEMLGGGLVYLVAPYLQPPPRWRRWLEAVGLGLILVSVSVFDFRSPWPGWRALVPTLATMMVVMVGHQSSWTGNRAAQWLGSRSYSIYLWHWPVLVAMVYTELNTGYLAIFFGTCLALFLGHLSYELVENPARRRLERGRRYVGAGLMISMVVAVAVPAAAVKGDKGVAGRFAPAVERAAAEAGNIHPRRTECHSLKGRESPSCMFGGPNLTVIAVGDSHVAAMVSAIAQSLPDAQAGVMQWSYSGCQFVAGMKKVDSIRDKLGSDYQCGEFVEWARARLESIPADVPLVIIGRYAQSAFGMNDERRNINVPEVYFSQPVAETTPAFLDEFSRSVVDSACQLAKLRRVYMVRPTPEMGFDVPRTLSRRMAWGRTADVSIPIEEYRKRNSWIWAAQDTARNQCGVRILDPSAYLCDKQRCFGSKNGMPLYYDDDHLSEYGNKLLVPMFSEMFRK